MCDDTRGFFLYSTDKALKHQRKHRREPQRPENQQYGDKASRLCADTAKADEMSCKPLNTDKQGCP